MIRYLPTIYPDELIYSWFCRTFVHSGAITNKSTLQELYCKRSDNPSKEFIGNLNPSARTLIDKLYSMDHLVSNHTMYPQYARFVPLEQKKTALYRLGHGTCDPHHLFSVLPRLKGEQHLRFCPLCVKEDREAYGETYWHRTHQLIGMTTCPIHHCYLQNSSVIISGKSPPMLKSAEEVIPLSESIEPSSEIENHLAQYMTEVFQSAADMESEVTVGKFLYSKMAKSKYRSLRGQQRNMELLYADFSNYCQRFFHMKLSNIFVSV